MVFSFFFSQKLEGRGCKEEGGGKKGLGRVYTRGITKTNPRLARPALCSGILSLFFHLCYPMLDFLLLLLYFSIYYLPIYDVIYSKNAVRLAIRVLSLPSSSSSLPIVAIKDDLGSRTKHQKQLSSRDMDPKAHLLSQQWANISLLRIPNRLPFPKILGRPQLTLKETFCS